MVARSIAAEVGQRLGLVRGDALSYLIAIAAVIPFVAMVLGLVAGWLRKRSGSIWPCVILHGVPNAAGAICAPSRAMTSSVGS